MLVGVGKGIGGCGSGGWVRVLVGVIVGNVVGLLEVAVKGFEWVC